MPEIRIFFRNKQTEMVVVAISWFLHYLTAGKWTYHEGDSPSFIQAAGCDFCRAKDTKCKDCLYREKLGRLCQINPLTDFEDPLPCMIEAEYQSQRLRA